MRPVSVVVLDDLTDYHAEVTRSGDQQVIEAFAAQGADEAFGDRIRPRGPHRCADDGDVGAGEDRVKAAVNLLSRSRITNRNWAARSPRSISKLRACWLTQAPVG